MNRLAIIVLYDKKGIIDESTIHLIKSLYDFAQNVVVISNGEIDTYDKAKIVSISDSFFLRDNKGYDGGAYKDCFLTYLKEDYLKQWDEIVILNDTFFGPIHPWKKVFDIMESQNVDFWGLTEQREDRLLHSGIVVPCHVQGYFIAIRQQLFLSNEFMDFWNDFAYPQTYWEAVWNYEIRFTNYFVKKGFKYVVFTDFIDRSFIENADAAFYIEYAYELIKYSDFPIVKKKPLLDLNRYHKYKSILEYIKCNSIYNEDLIINHIDRIKWYKEGNGGISMKDILVFCANHKKLYIYGKGRYGNLINEFLIDNGINVLKYIVSDENFESERDANTIPLSKYISDAETGIIIGVGRNTYEQIVTNVKGIESKYIWPIVVPEELKKPDNYCV